MINKITIGKKVNYTYLVVVSLNVFVKSANKIRSLLGMFNYLVTMI